MWREDGFVLAFKEPPSTELREAVLELARGFEQGAIFSYTYDSATNQLWRATVPCERQPPGAPMLPRSSSTTPHEAPEVVLLEVVPMMTELTAEQRAVVGREWAGPAGVGELPPLSGLR